MTLLAAITVTSEAAARDATGFDWFLLFCYLTLALAVSSLCSLMEAALLSISSSYVEVLTQRGKPGGKRLQSFRADLDRPLAAILTLNTAAHTFGAAGAGAQILVIFGNSAVATGSIIVTLLILVFSEIIPKSLGARYNQPLAPVTAGIVQGMIWITLPLLIPLQWISKLFGGGHIAAVTRDEVAMTAEMGHSAGVLLPRESRVIGNLLRLGQVQIQDIMTPRPVMFTLHHDQSVERVLADHPRLRFSRMPVIEQSPDHVVGVVTRNAILMAMNDGQGARTMSELARPIEAVPELAHVAETLEAMIEKQQHAMIVVDEFGGTAGMVTLEDCVETLLGVEIVDETDTVENMREAARRLLSKRRERLGASEG